jgi:hypothetical protein
MSNGAETGKMILDVTNFKATWGVQTTSTAGAERCIDSSYSDASYDHAGINGSCNSYATTIKATSFE